MLSIFKKKELEGMIVSLEANMSNNYKDNAQSNLQELKTQYHNLLTDNKLSNKQKQYYQELIDTYDERMKGFTHKDQKPYWT